MVVREERRHCRAQVPRQRLVAWDARHRVRQRRMRLKQRLKASRQLCRHLSARVGHDERAHTGAPRAGSTHEVPARRRGFAAAAGFNSAAGRAAVARNRVGVASAVRRARSAMTKSTAAAAVAVVVGAWRLKRREGDHQ
eukprot:197216-Chlamydomonas_euryale.AAC.1